jgi:hypothetical protein
MRARTNCWFVAAARHHANACEVLFRRELGRAPDPWVRRAADDHGQDEASIMGDRAAAIGQLEAGRAAVAAGAVEPGIACLRQACGEARGVGEPALLARGLAALGAALVHALGDPGGVPAARLLGKAIDNPALHAEFATAV